jgi:ParB family chromosome partitioning protein
MSASCIFLAPRRATVTAPGALKPDISPECPIHHARKERPATDAAFKAEQEKRRREEAIAQATGLRVLKATSDAVPIRLMKRDLLFVTERLAATLDERRLAIIFRLHGIGKASGAGDAPAKLLASFLRKADESTLGRVLVAITILQSAHSSNESAKALREAAEFYKVDVAAITATVKQEFAAKEKTQAARKATDRAKPNQQRTVATKKAKAA